MSSTTAKMLAWVSKSRFAFVFDERGLPFVPNHYKIYIAEHPGCFEKETAKKPPICIFCSKVSLFTLPLVVFFWGGMGTGMLFGFIRSVFLHEIGICGWTWLVTLYT